ncbi:MAG: phytoene/squalene synthase family protein [Spirochaetaceae bacterium]|nr:phytoene/squalene synthase family protein [Spirochaetaceae bacterium]MDT8298443.1 phytoene/squalene synthase family protein [Spirochaetaceae bacterium]
MRKDFQEMPQYSVFKGGSKTYFNSSLFFPEDVRRDVFILYGFVRVADDFVDSTPQDECGFAAFCQAWERAECGDPAGDRIIDDFVELSQRRNFSADWTRAFLASMAADLATVAFHRLEETLAYIYGSAEVIGLYMSRILGLPDAALPHARMLGRAMQYINFLRDIAEDVRLGRRYLPLGNSGLTDLSEETARSSPKAFAAWFRSQSSLYRLWHAEGERGYGYIPWRYLLPIRTAEDMYLWTASVLESNPLMVYERKVKPPKRRIRGRAFLNAFVPVERRNIPPVNSEVPGGLAEPVVKDYTFIHASCEEVE